MTIRYTFRITDSYKPETIPMARLAEYMAEYAKLLGETTEVHFEEVVDKSVGVVAVIDEPAVQRVKSRVFAARLGSEAPHDIARIVKKLDDMLANDNAFGELLSDGEKIIAFPGRTRRERQVFGPFTQAGTLDGEIVRVGGQDDTIHVHLRDGDTVISQCVTTPEIGRELGHHLLGPIVRVHGEGRWFRDGNGAWTLKQFRIRDFKVLDDPDLATVVSQLRAVKGNEWAAVDDPVRTVLDERGGGGRPH